jgi:Uma2 family endonuclease
MQLTVPIPERQGAVRLPGGVFRWSEEEFFRFCQANPELRIERSAKGEIIVMSPAGGYAGYQSGEVFRQLSVWMDEYRNSGLPLGWLILPASTQVEVYTSSGVEVRTAPQAISADPTLPGFKLELAPIWNPPF